MKKKFQIFKNEKLSTYTKKAVKALLLVGIINGTMPYLLALLDKEPVYELGMAWVTEIVAVILGYLCKAYFETKQEKKNELEEKKIEKEGNGCSNMRG